MIFDVYESWLLIILWIIIDNYAYIFYIVF